ncbi:MBL fold metallo-hydrolase [Erwinia amylovora]|nr:MBL fold metallo-hydrolase [Erwinia amylovora]
MRVTQVSISHAHLDHIGGLASVRDAFPQARVRSPLARTDHLSCR